MSRPRALLAPPALLALLALSGGPARADWEPQDKVAAAFNEGVLALEGGQPDRAEAAFQRALDGDPSCGRCAHGLGLALLRQQRPALALPVLRQAAARHPDQPALQTALAGADFAAQDFASALEHARAATDLDQSSVDAHVALTQVLLRLGQPDSAGQALAAATLPGPERACLDLLIAVEQGQEPGASTLAYCRQAAHPGLATTVQTRVAADAGQLAATAALAGQSGVDTVEQVARAMRLHQQGQDAQALPLLDAALAAEPHRVDARILRALARARTDQLDPALADLRLVLGARAWVQVHRTGEMSGVLTASDEVALQRSVRQGAGLLVSLLVQAGRLDEATATLEQARQALGEGVELAAGEVRLWLARGDAPAAWRALEQGLITWPDDPDLVLLASELSGQDPQGAPPALTARLASAADWRASYHLAVAASGRQDHVGCADLADRSARLMARGNPPPTPQDRVTVRRLWHACAVNAELADQAERAAAALDDPASMHEVARIQHARLRLEAGDREGALALLQGIQPTTEPRRAQVEQLRGLAQAD